jgi:putative membrane protein
MMFLVHTHLDTSVSTAWFADTGPTAIVATLVVGYATGVRRAWIAAGAGRGITRREIRCFAGAVALLTVALLSPLDALSDDLFVAHMGQHLLLAVLLPPFLVLGAPERALFWGLPLATRRQLARSSHRYRRVRAFWQRITLPVVACALHAVAVWLWHAPRLYELALRDGGVHMLEHLSFVGTGVLLWWRIVHPATERRNAYGVGILTLFVTAMQTGVLGALLTFSHRVLYPAQATGAAVWGLSPLDDQQLAGLVMWVVGGLLYVVAMSALFALWLSPGSRRRTGRALVAASTVGIAGCGRAPSISIHGGDPQRGKVTIAAMGCGACHVIGGVAMAHGEVGPPLDGVARRAIIGGALPNTPENMMLWIEDPPAIAPNTAMPNLGISPQSARDIVAYLYTLK